MSPTVQSVSQVEHSPNADRALPRACERPNTQRCNECETSRTVSALHSLKQQQFVGNCYQAIPRCGAPHDRPERRCMPAAGLQPRKSTTSGPPSLGCCVFGCDNKAPAVRGWSEQLSSLFKWCFQQGACDQDLLIVCLSSHSKKGSGLNRLAIPLLCMFYSFCTTACAWMLPPCHLRECILSNVAFSPAQHRSWTSLHVGLWNM